jgi:hypothetical protein
MTHLARQKYSPRKVNLNSQKQTTISIIFRKMSLNGIKCKLFLKILNIYYYNILKLFIFIFKSKRKILKRIL